METRKILINSHYWTRAIKTCKRCGEEFHCQPSKVARIRHCNDCNAIIRKPPGSILCEYCGAEKKVKGHLVGVQKYCSPECKWNASTLDPSQSWRYAKPRRCLECGNVFQPTKQRTYYCGIDCWKGSQIRVLADAARRRAEIAALNPPPPRKPRTRPLKPPRKRPEFTCLQCGVLCDKPRHKETTRLFCSRPCRSKYISGERHPLYKEARHRDKRGPGWDKIAESVRQRDNYQCQRCGRKQTEPALHVHHIEPYAVAQNNHPDNLVTLCKGCHKTVEHSPWRLVLADPT